jgi:hypothetical protein
MSSTADAPWGILSLKVQARYVLERRRLNYSYFFPDELGIKPDYSQQILSTNPSELCKPVGG